MERDAGRRGASAGQYLFECSGTARAPTSSATRGGVGGWDPLRLHAAANSGLPMPLSPPSVSNSNARCSGRIIVASAIHEKRLHSSETAILGLAKATTNGSLMVATFVLAATTTNVYGAAAAVKSQAWDASIWSHCVSPTTGVREAISSITEAADRTRSDDSARRAGGTPAGPE
jgi:hypothetical protein